MHGYSIILRYDFDEFYDKYIGPELHQQVEFIIAVAYNAASHQNTFIIPFHTKSVIFVSAQTK